MPQTFPGFLVVSGVLILVIGLIGGPVEFFRIRLPKLDQKVRYVMIAMGSAFLAIGFKIYFDFMLGKSPNLPTLIR
jgi:uncharacterized membrane protein